MRRRTRGDSVLGRVKDGEGGYEVVVVIGNARRWTAERCCNFAGGCCSLEVSCSWRHGAKDPGKSLVGERDGVRGQRRCIKRRLEDDNEVGEMGLLMVERLKEPVIAGAGFQMRKELTVGTSRAVKGANSNWKNAASGPG